jgi:sec-independent protein translocase protein TatB
MGGLDPGKVLIILLVALIVLGPERLPRAARQVGAMWRELTRLREKVEDEVRSAMPDLDLPPIPTMPRGGLTGYLTGMMTSVSSSASPAAGAGGALSGEAGIAEAGSDFGVGGPAEAGTVLATGWAGTSGAGSGGFSGGGGGWAGISSSAALPEGVPAGWQSVGAPAPGYASGSLLSPVPVGSNSGLLDAEASFTFDEPSWN